MKTALRNSVTKARTFLGSVANILFPPVCMSCRTPVATHGMMCGPCWQGLNFITDPKCHKCGLPFEYGTGTLTLCGQCIASPPAFTRACSVFRYDEHSRPHILAFKFQDRTSFSHLFGQWLYHLAMQEFATQYDVIIPVPLHYRRLIDRRYNQASLLAQALSRLAHRPLLAHSLCRRRNTTAQSGLSRSAREQNVRGAFIVPPNKRHHIQGKTVLLVDDVMTTGATLSACARVLRDAGARDVYVLTLARTVLAE